MGIVMLVLHFLYLVRPYPWNIANLWFIFQLCVIALCMMHVIYIYIYISAYMCMGDCALCMMDSSGYVSDPL